jgi:hypothetical protein
MTELYSITENNCSNRLLYFLDRAIPYETSADDVEKSEYPARWPQLLTERGLLGTQLPDLK